MRSFDVTLDFRWTDTAGATEPIAGMSESLAEGLVSRFIDKWDRDGLSSLARLPPPLTQKRAAAFRHGCHWLRRVIPSELQIMSVLAGDARGRDKHSTFTIVSWMPDSGRKWLTAAWEALDARGPAFTEGLLLGLSRHALVRLFQRLRTTNDADVLREASHAVTIYFPWGGIHRHLLGLPDIFVPTPNGAMLISRDDAEAPLTEAFCKTWISNARMAETARRLAAVDAARRERGFVLMANGQLVVVSAPRVGANWSRQAIFEYVRSQVGHLQRGGQAVAAGHPRRPLPCGRRGSA